MLQLINFYWQVCCLKQGPQNAPNSIVVLKTTVVMYIGVSLLLAHLSSSWLSSAAQVTVEVATVFLFCLLVLSYSGQYHRFWQTAISVFGTDTIISFLALPVFSFIASGKAWDIAYIFVLLLVFWHWLVTGHIVRHALDKSLITGLGISFLYIYVSFKLMIFLFG